MNFAQGWWVRFIFEGEQGNAVLFHAALLFDDVDRAFPIGDEFGHFSTDTGDSAELGLAGEEDFLRRIEVGKETAHPYRADTR